MLPANGGDAEVPWVKLSPADIAQVGINALGEDFKTVLTPDKVAGIFERM